MKILLVCSSDYMAIPAALVLQQAGMLSAIAIPGKYDKRLRPSFLQSGFPDAMLHTLTKEFLETELLSLLEQYAAETVFVMSFPWTLSKPVLERPVYGCLNFHPGALPQYAGADPVFWQIKNQEKNSCMSVHQMTEQVDAGPVLYTRQLPVIPGETYGMYFQRMGQLAAEIVMPVVQLLEKNAPAGAQPAGESLYFKKPVKQQVTIDWQTQTAEEIEALVNAGNPRYNGAFTTLRNRELTLLEVSFATINGVAEDTTPGTIVYADELYGLIVACKDKGFLMIKTVCMPEGYFSGSKLFRLGFRVGEVFL